MRRFLGLTVGVAILSLASLPARAITTVTGQFLGTILSGTDTTHVFGAATDLTGQSIVGNFFYIPSLFSAIDSTTKTATSTKIGAFTISVKIGSQTYTFTDNTGSSILVDPSSSEVMFQTSNVRTSGSRNYDETLSFDLLDPITPFITASTLNMGFKAFPWITSGSFRIADTGSTVVTSSASFAISEIRVPEPDSAYLLLAAGGGLGLALRHRRRRAAK